MAFRFDWSQISNPFVEEGTRDVLNDIIESEVVPHMMGGFVYIEKISFGTQTPIIGLVALDELSTLI